MNMKGLGIAMGLGAAAGAVAILMTPKDGSIRNLANKAARKVEDTAMTVGDKLMNKMDM